MSSLFSIRGKNILITGGSRGIGLMIAHTLAVHGANILLTSRDANACADAAASIQQSCNEINGEKLSVSECHHVASNVNTRQGCKELAEYTKQLFHGRLDVLVNNAGCSWGEDPYDTETESGKMNWGWDKVMDLNVKGLFYLTRECVPMLERQTPCEKFNNANSNTDSVNDDPGRVINIGSVAGLIPMETPTHAYDASKAAVHHLTKKMASDLAKKGITVNAVAPGFVETRMSQGLGKWVKMKEKNEDRKSNGMQHVKNNIPLGRMGTEEDIAGACIYLSSRAGAWCTGVILNVDGGTTGCLQIPLFSKI